jgi:serpin B
MLSMAASAAEGQTRATVLRALGLDPSTDPSAGARQTIESLTRSDADVRLELAQAVWAERGLPLSPSYVTRLHNDYKAQIANLDFQSPGAPAVVNQWVDNATHHKITQLVDGFDPNVVGYLVNATYFHAMWQNKFDSNGSGDFHTFGGTTAQVAMMKRTENVTVLGSPDYTGALLPYQGGRFSALLLLPVHRLSPADFASFLTPASWSQALRYLHEATDASLGGSCKSPNTLLATNVGVDCEGTLVMPKFTLEYKKDLTKTLGAMGLPIPGAELTGFCAGCFLSDVVQKTYLQVDEQGTTAAAAAGGAVATAGHVPMVVDRPFVFAIIDNATDAPLFLGAIGNL